MRKDAASRRVRQLCDDRIRAGQLSDGLWPVILDCAGYAKRRVLVCVCGCCIHDSTSSDVKHRDSCASSRMPTMLVWVSLWYPNQKSDITSATILIAAVAFAVKTTSKSSGSALKYLRTCNRVWSTLWVERADEGDAE